MNLILVMVGFVVFRQQLEFSIFKSIISAVGVVVAINGLFVVIVGCCFKTWRGKKKEIIGKLPSRPFFALP